MNHSPLLYRLAAGDARSPVDRRRTDPARQRPRRSRSLAAGRGIEAGESEEEALRRELLEEADAEIVDFVRFGVLLRNRDDGGSHTQAFYWCRVVVPDGAFVPRLEVSGRHLVAPDDFLDTLFWGHTDALAPMILSRALEIERSR